MNKSYTKQYNKTKFDILSVACARGRRLMEHFSMAIFVRHWCVRACKCVRKAGMTGQLASRISVMGSSLGANAHRII